MLPPDVQCRSRRASQVHTRREHTAAGSPVAAATQHTARLFERPLRRRSAPARDPLAAAAAPTASDNNSQAAAAAAALLLRPPRRGLRPINQCRRAALCAWGPYTCGDPTGAPSQRAEPASAQPRGGRGLSKDSKGCRLTDCCPPAPVQTQAAQGLSLHRHSVQGRNATRGQEARRRPHLTSTASDGYCDVKSHSRRQCASAQPHHTQCCQPVQISVCGHNVPSLAQCHAGLYPKHRRSHRDQPQASCAGIRKMRCSCSSRAEASKLAKLIN